MEGLGGNLRKKRNKILSTSFSYVICIFLLWRVCDFIVRHSGNDLCQLLCDNRIAPDSILFFHLETMIHNIPEEVSCPGPDTA